MTAGHTRAPACPGWCRYRATGHPLVGRRRGHVSVEQTVWAGGFSTKVAVTVLIQQRPGQPTPLVVYTFGSTTVSLPLPEAKYLATVSDSLIGDYWAQPSPSVRNHDRIA